MGARMLRKKLILFAIAALVALLATGWISDGATRKMTHAVQSVDHTRQVLVAIDAFRAAVAESESNARGYVITDEVVFLDRFDRATRTVTTALAHLKQLTPDNSHQVAAVQTLDRLTERRLSLLRLLV